MAGIDVVRLRATFEAPHELVRTSGGKILFLRRWDAAGSGDTAFLILHGITAHSGPYGPLLAEEVARAGFPTFGMDLRGHGLSDGRRGDMPSRERLLEDLRETLATVRAKVGRVVLLGHSLGALNAVLAANAFPDRIDGLALVSVGRQIRRGVYAKPTPRALLKTLVGVSLLRHRPLIEYRRAGMTGTDDPLFNFAYSARFMSLLFGAPALAVARMFREGEIDSPNLAFGAKPRMPVFVAVGDRDEIFPVESTRAFFDSIEADDKTFVVIPGAGHAAFPRGGWGPLVAWARARWASSG